MSQKLPNIPVTMDSELLAEIDRVAAARKEKRSATMRAALRVGLRILEGGGSDSLTLDSETDHYVNLLANGYKRTRNGILIEAIRRGVAAVEAHLMQTDTNAVDPDIAKWAARSIHGAEPLLDEVRKAQLERFLIWNQFNDLLQHCPEARERKAVVEKLDALNRWATGSGYSMWGKGVGTDELKRQIAKREKEAAERGASVNPQPAASGPPSLPDAGPPTKRQGLMRVEPLALVSVAQPPASPPPPVTDQAAEKPVAKPKRAKGKK